MAGASLLLLAGCATAPLPAAQVDLTGRSCAAQPDLGIATGLAFTGKEEQSFNVPFSGSDACVQTAKGPALYHAFQVPDGAEQLTFRLASTPQQNSLLPFRVILADSKGAVMRKFSGDALMFRGSQLSLLFRGHPGEAYLIVEADPGVTGQSVSRIQESTGTAVAVTPAVAFAVHYGNDATMSYIFTQTGVVTITLTPPPPPPPKTQ
ncbi:MAG TPA: hypothetical protein VGG48_19295 [Rhizomicrobium sp.]|jgi:hypothetical protein